MPFGQLVVGPPGSGKTTYCNGLHQFLSALGRKTTIVNLDPANENVPYECALDIRDLVSLEDAVEAHGLGPNGGLIYCMEYLEQNLDWLQENLANFKDTYILFDCPGQVELFTHHESLRHIVDALTKWDYRLTAVHLVDAHYCSDASKFISVVTLSLSTMLQLELPHINVLSKIDLVEQYGKLAFGLDFYTEVLDLDYLVARLDEESGPGFAALNRAMAGLVQDYSLVNFCPLNISDKKSVMHLMRTIDKSNGYIFGGLERGNESILLAAASQWQWHESRDGVEEQYVDQNDEDLEQWPGAAADPDEYEDDDEDGGGSRSDEER